MPPCFHTSSTKDPLSRSLFWSLSFDELNPNKVISQQSLLKQFSLRASSGRADPLHVPFFAGFLWRGSTKKRSRTLDTTNKLLCLPSGRPQTGYFGNLCWQSFTSVPWKGCVAAIVPSIGSESSYQCKGLLFFSDWKVWGNLQMYKSRVGNRLFHFPTLQSLSDEVRRSGNDISMWSADAQVETTHTSAHFSLTQLTKMLHLWGGGINITSRVCLLSLQTKSYLQLYFQW